MIQTAIALSVLATLLSFGANRWLIAWRAAQLCLVGVAVCLVVEAATT